MPRISTEAALRGPDWGRLGLTGNPFENVAPGERLEWVCVPDGVRRALAARPFRVELVGPKGAGKSTVLRALLAELPRAQLRYLAPGDRLALPDPGVETFAVDEADRASPGELRLLGRDADRRGLSLLFGTHRPLAADLGLALSSFALAEAPALEWVGKRVAARRIGDTPRFEEVAARLWPKLGTNYGVLRALYELAEELARGAPLDDEAISAALGKARAAAGE